jgi:cysteinyl-tRNA synthetase
VFTLVREANTAFDTGGTDAATLEAVVDWLHDIDAIWAILPERSLREVTLQHGDRKILLVGPEVPDDVFDCIAARSRARADRDFAAADALRDELRGHGVEVEDTPDGARWKLIGPSTG